MSNIKMVVDGRAASFDSKQVVSYGSKENFLKAMNHLFDHVSEKDRDETLASVYDKAVSEEYQDHETEELDVD